MDDKHPCTQERVLATMCEQLKNIEADIKEIRDGQRVFMQSLSDSQTNSAKYPSPDFVNKSIAKLDRHELFFKIIWIALGGAWSVLLVILGIWIKGWI